VLPVTMKSLSICVSSIENVTPVDVTSISQGEYTESV
jgi:hypothetical protein